MSSTNTYTEQKYCVYITYYSGDKLPPNYIGSSSVDKINNGYFGSVKSKQYKSIWKQELKQNPHLFSIEIISYHDTRPEATYKELQLQKIFNVVKNSLFVNMGYAAPNGFFGMDTSGIPKTEEHKRKIGNANKGKVHTEEQRLANSLRQKNRKASEETKNKMSISHQGRSNGPHTVETKNKISSSLRGKCKPPLSGEHKTKISNSLHGKCKPPLSLKTKDKISKSMRGKNTGPKSEEHKQKLRKPKPHFLSIIETKKTYTKANIAYRFPDLKQYF